MLNKNFVNDKYKTDRGNYSRLLKIDCEKCGEFVCFYQKDGPGNLRRMYFDRIFKNKNIIKNKNLYCKNKHLLGVKILYEKENRNAFRLFVESVNKKVVSTKNLKN